MSRSVQPFLVVAFLTCGVLSPARSESPPAGRKTAVQNASALRTDLYDDPLPEGAIARLGTLRFRHNEITTIAWSPDGKTLASGSPYYSTRLWEVATGKEVGRLQGHATTLAWSPDGKLLASGSKGNDRGIHLWDVATGKELRRFMGHEASIESVAWSPDGKTLTSGGQDKTIRLWDVATGKEVRRLIGHEKSVHTVAWSADGKMLASSSSDKTIRLWDQETGREVRRLSLHDDPQVDWGQTLDWAPPLAWSPARAILASGSWDMTFRLWNADTGKEVRRLTGQGADIDSVAWSPDGKTLASGECQWDAASGKELKRLTGNGIYSVVWSPDGKTLASASSVKHRRGTRGATICLWNPATGQEIRDREGHESSVSSVCWSLDGKVLASGGWDKTIRLWDPVTAKQIRKLTAQERPWHLTLRSDAVRSLAWSPDGKTLASQGKTISLWEVATGNEIRQLNGYDTASWPDPWSVAWVSNGLLLASANEDTISLWDPASSKVVRRFGANAWRNLDGLIFQVAWSPDGKSLASLYGDGSVNLWEPVTGKKLQTLNNIGKDNGGTSLAWSPDSRTLALAGKRIRLWNATTGKEIRQFSGHGGGVLSLAWSPDGKTLASVSGNSICLWELATGKEIRRFAGHDGTVFSLAWCPDGKRLASAGDDSTVLIWAIHNHPDEPPLRLELSDVKSCWADLEGNDAAKAHQAICTLIRGARHGVPFLADQLKLVPPPDPKHVRLLIDDLDSEQFAVRQKATAELERLDELAEPALRTTLAQKPPLEVRQRIEQLLSKLARSSPESLRALRATTVLEHIGSPEARKVLETLATGAEGARLTKEAKASLERLNRRAAGDKP